MNYFCAFIMIMTLFMNNLWASRNLTAHFKSIYHQQKDFTAKEISELKKYDIVFIPGILAESVIDSDNRSILNLSLLTRDYFHTQLEILTNKYQLPVTRLTTSSRNVAETQRNIRRTVKNAQNHGRKVIFISHSLGGLALFEEVILNPSIQDGIAGVAFLQSPFYGSPLEELITNPPYKVINLIKPLLPLLNLSLETFDFVSVENRTQFMKDNKEAIARFIKRIPIYTFTGVADANKSILKPVIDILEHGCLRGVKLGCLTETFFYGPYDKSDGFIPFKSSFIDGSDYVIMDDIDHVEFIVNVPFEDYKKEHLTTAWLRVLLGKIK